MEPDRLPPHSLEAEQGVLGCILLAEPAESRELLQRVQWDDFYDLRHQTILRALEDLTQKGTPIDTISLQTRLKELNLHDSAGGLAYLSALPDTVPSPANFDYYRETIRKHRVRRKALALASNLSQLAWDEDNDILATVATFPTIFANAIGSAKKEEEWFSFKSPAHHRRFQPQRSLLLVGDSHITRGEVTLISGPPGSGKSRVIAALARSGASKLPWMGLAIHHRFKTAILQNENGPLRLKKDFDTEDADDLTDWVRVSEPPPMGMAFDRPEFRLALKTWIADWRPDIVVFDPWNSAARDDGQRDYLALFQFIKETLPKGDDAPALIIVAHTRKPKGDERKAGRSLIHDVAGSHVLVSVPRCVFNLQPATDDPTDNRVIWTCCKNNNGELGPRSAWTRSATDFTQITDFNWEKYDRPQRSKGGRPPKITLDDLRELFDDGKRRIEPKTAAKELQEMTGASRAACYGALSLNGKFCEHLRQDEENLLFFTNGPDLQDN